MTSTCRLSPNKLIFEVPRYCSHTIILPDESRLDNHVVEMSGTVITYYPFTGEVHSTIYINTPILLSYRADLEGETVSLSRPTWTVCDATEKGDRPLYAYRLTSCSSSIDECYVVERL